MVIRLTPELEKIVEDRVKSGQFRTPEDVIAEALRTLNQKEDSAGDAERKAKQREAVEEVLRFIEKNRVRLDGISVKDLIHEGHRL